MIAVIIAGGSGTRLWPLSTPQKPKHLLKLTGERSLLQDAYDRARLCTDDIYVVTDISHSELVQDQLPELNQARIIVEPGRRGTASCIILALAYIQSRVGDDSDVAFLHADHHIIDRQAFADAVRIATVSARKHHSIALIGIRPDYPATGFGYIKQGKQLNGVYQVERFQEKPDIATARRYVESGEYLWNLGLFAAPLTTFKSTLEAVAPPLNLAFERLVHGFEHGGEIASIYRDLEEEAIDTAVIEKASNVIVVPGVFDWLDIGSYKELSDVMPSSDELGNVIQGDVKPIDTRNSIIISHHRPVAVIGLENVVIIETEDGLLVCDKDAAQQVKDAAKHFNGKMKK